MLILRAKIALNAVSCVILVIFSLIMESWLLRNVGFYRSFWQFSVDCDGEYKYIIWNNREIKIHDKSLFYKRNLSKVVKYTKDLLCDKTNIDSFNSCEGEKSLNSNFFDLERIETCSAVKSTYTSSFFYRHSWSGELSMS